MCIRDRATREKAKAEIVGILGERARSGAGPITYGDLARQITDSMVVRDLARQVAIGDRPCPGSGSFAEDADDLGLGLLPRRQVVTELRHHAVPSRSAAGTAVALTFSPCPALRSSAVGGHRSAPTLAARRPARCPRASSTWRYAPRR